MNKRKNRHYFVLLWTDSWIFLEIYCCFHYTLAVQLLHYQDTCNRLNFLNIWKKHQLRIKKYLVDKDVIMFWLNFLTSKQNRCENLNCIIWMYVLQSFYWYLCVHFSMMESSYYLQYRPTTCVSSHTSKFLITKSCDR